MGEPEDAARGESTGVRKATKTRQEMQWGLGGERGEGRIELRDWGERKSVLMGWRG